MDNIKKRKITSLIADALLEHQHVMAELSTLGIDMESIASEKITNTSVLREVIEYLWDMHDDAAYEAIDYFIYKPESREERFKHFQTWND